MELSIVDTVEDKEVMFLSLVILKDNLGLMKNTHVVWLGASSEVMSKSLAREHVINNGYCCCYSCIDYAQKQFFPQY